MTKYNIINEIGMIERCYECGHNIFRITKNKCKYTNKEKTEGIYRDIKICVKCNNKQYLNEIHFKVVKND